MHIKKTLLAVGLSLALPLAAQAAQPAEQQDTCTFIAEIAETVMSARQAGVDVVQIMQVVDDLNIPALSEFVLLAYRQPEYHTRENKQRAVRTFRTQAYTECRAGE